MRIGIDARPLEWQRGAVARFILRMIEYYCKEKKDETLLSVAQEIENVIYD